MNAFGRIALVVHACLLLPAWPASAQSAAEIGIVEKFRVRQVICRTGPEDGAPKLPPIDAPTGAVAIPIARVDSATGLIRISLDGKDCWLSPSVVQRNTAATSQAICDRIAANTQSPGSTRGIGEGCTGRPAGGDRANQPAASRGTGRW